MPDLPAASATTLAGKCKTRVSAQLPLPFFPYSTVAGRFTHRGPSMTHVEPLAPLHIPHRAPAAPRPQDRVVKEEMAVLFCSLLLCMLPPTSARLCPARAAAIGCLRDVTPFPLAAPSTPAAPASE